MYPRFYIKKPQKTLKGVSRLGKRVSFSIYKQIEHLDGHTENETIKDARIVAINAKYQTGVVSYEDALSALLKLKDEFTKDFGPPDQDADLNEENIKLAKEYIEKEYKHRELKDPDTAEGDILRSVKALGNTSLLSARASQIQAKLDQYHGDKKRKITGRISAILKFIGRTDVRLKRAPLPRPKVKYVNKEELVTALKAIHYPQGYPEEGKRALETLCWVIFYTGARLGEAFAMKEENIIKNDKVISIETQIDKKNKEREPKWGSIRDTYIIPDGITYLRLWFEQKKDIVDSRIMLSRRLKEACAAKFTSKLKHCTMKDLRHSYAKQLVEKGISIVQIAQLLGNTELVCQRYYAGFQTTDETIELIDRKVTGKDKEK